MNKTNKSFFSSAHGTWHSVFCKPTPLYLGAFIFIVFKLVSDHPITPNDYWWYVRLGQDILQNNTVPNVDTYTYTQLGKPYTYNAWLSSVVFWLFREPTQATLLQSTLVTIFCGLTWQCCRTVGEGIKLSAVLTLIVLLGSTAHWIIMRPQLFSYPLFSLTLLSLLNWQRGNSSWVWLLPVISILWVNFHGAFPLLFLLTGAALVGGEGNRLILVQALLLSFTTSLINPYYYNIWTYVLSTLIDTPTQLGPEWRPPTIETNWQSKFFYICLLLFPVIVSLSPRKLKLTEWLWFIGFGWMAVSGLRYIVWFFSVLGPITAILLAPLTNKTFDKPKSLAKPFLNTFIFFLLILLPLPGINKYWTHNQAPAYSRNTPIAAVKWLKSHPKIPGNVWADQAMSVYLIYALQDRLVWIDLRTNLFPIEQWNNYLNIENAENNWENLLNENNINILLLDLNKQPRLIQKLNKSINWQSVYKDEYSIIFTGTRI